MSAVSKKVMPASSAASSTAPVPSRSSRRPKLLQPSPTAETSSSESPSRRVGSWVAGALALIVSPLGLLAVATTRIRTIRAADAGTRQAQPALHAWAGRAARSRRPRRNRFPPRLRLGPGRPARRRHLLHPLGLPDHGHPALAARPARPHRLPSLLGRPRPAPAAGPFRDAGDRHRLGDDLRPRSTSPVPGGGRLGGLLRQQLGADPRQRLLLRPLRAGRPAQPPLVAFGRGAVLHPLAVPAAGRGQARPRTAAPLRRPPPPSRADDRRRGR